MSLNDAIFDGSTIRIGLVKTEQQANLRGEVTPDRFMDLVKGFVYAFPVAVISNMPIIPTHTTFRVQIRRNTSHLVEEFIFDLVHRWRVSKDELPSKRYFEVSEHAIGSAIRESVLERRNGNARLQGSADSFLGTIATVVATA